MNTTCSISNDCRETIISIQCDTDTGRKILASLYKLQELREREEFMHQRALLKDKNAKPREWTIVEKNGEYLVKEVKG